MGLFVAGVGAVLGRLGAREPPGALPWPSISGCTCWVTIITATARCALAAILDRRRRNRPLLRRSAELAGRFSVGLRWPAAPGSPSGAQARPAAALAADLVLVLGPAPPTPLAAAA